MTGRATKSFRVPAAALLGAHLDIFIDRPAGSRHPVYDYEYPVNYGYAPGMPGGDGKEMDAYFLPGSEPLQRAEGIVRAVVIRRNDPEDKLVVCPPGVTLARSAIERLIAFQEQFFETELQLSTR